MKVTYYPNKINKDKAVLILGSFEYVHNGHLKLIEEAKKVRKNVSIMIAEDPMKLPKSDRKRITSLENRLEMVARLGIQQVYVIKFDKKLLITEGKNFMKQLVDSANAVKLVMGKDFQAGVRGSYKAKDIAHDFSSKVINLEKYHNAKVSSLLIAEFIQLGQVDKIKEISPFAWEIYLSFNAKKEVTNFPYLKPHSGIYAVGVIVNDIYYWGVFHFSKSGQAKLYVPDLKVVNKPFRANIVFHKKVRTIISQKEDQMTIKDKQVAARYLYTL